MIENVYWSSCKVPVTCLSDLNETYFSYELSKNIQISNFMKIRSVGAEIFHADRRKDRHDEANSRFS